MLERPARTAMTILGIALGVAVSVAIRTANVEVLRSFEEAVLTVAGRTNSRFFPTTPGAFDEISTCCAGNGRPIRRCVMVPFATRLGVFCTAPVASSATLAGSGTTLVLGNSKLSSTTKPVVGTMCETWMARNVSPLIVNGRSGAISISFSTGVMSFGRLVKSGHVWLLNRWLRMDATTSGMA